MDDNLIKYAQGLIKNLKDAAPNLQGFANAIDTHVKNSIEELKKTDPAKAEKTANDYAKIMSEANLPDKIKDLNKAFESIRT